MGVDSNNCQSNSSTTMLEPGNDWEIFGHPGKFELIFFRIKGIRDPISVAVYLRTRGASAILNKPVPEL